MLVGRSAVLTAGAATPVTGPRSPIPGRLLAGRYRIGEPLGQGAVAQVFAAIDTRTGQEVAVKLSAVAGTLSVEHRADWLARMQREVAVTRLLNHPDVLALKDAGIDTDCAWLVTERVNGHDLARYTCAARLLPEPLALHVCARVGAVLAYAHTRGVVHRDLKPGNVLVDLSANVVKLADFGVARYDDAHATRTGVTLGTPAYMAPEQLGGAPASAATDAYSLGVLTYEMLSGKRPHEAPTLGELLRAMASGPPPPLAELRGDLPPSVTALVDQLLARDPLQRPEDLLQWARQAAALAGVMARVQQIGPR